MPIINIILGSLLMLMSIFLVVVILLQDKKKKGLSGAIAGSSDSLMGRNKGMAESDKKLSKFTTIVSIVFTVLVLVTYFII